MGNRVRSAGETMAQRSNGIFSVFINFVLIVLVLLVTGCAPSVSAVEIAAQNTQAIQPTDTLPPVPTATSTVPAATVTPTAAPTATAVPSVSLTFRADADSYVKQSDPSTNYGSKPSLQVDSGKQAVESLIQFTVTGVSGTVEQALLRVYTTKNGSKDGPAVYAADASWSEKTITWPKRPTHDKEPLDNKGEINTESWVDYNVTSAVHGNGTFGFVLVADSEDAISFSSREGLHPPELVVTFGGNVTPTAAPTLLSSTEDVTFVGAGDISMCDNDNDELTAKLLDQIPGTVFTLGDNAYPDGKHIQFTDCYDPTWGRHKDRTRPIPGNHEYHTEEAAGYFAYFDNIPPYYAYNLGGWRIYALNSEIDVSETGPQVKWLQEDLATHPSQCVLAYWHEPRWSSGTTHGNNADYQVLWRIFYEAGAELVLNGHEHSYEIFEPMNAEGNPDPFGLREIVVGTGGGPLYPFGTPLPTSQIRNNTTYGVLKLTLHPASYDWEFVPVAGSTFTDSGSTPCH